MIGAGLAHKPILRRRPAVLLQFFLQRRFPVGLRNAVAALLQRVVKQYSLQESSCGLQAGVKENGGYDRLESVGEQRGFIAASGFFLAAAEAQVFAESECARRPLQRTCVHQPRAAFRKLAFGPVGESFQQIFACQQIEDGIAQEFQPLVVSGRSGSARIFALAYAQIRDGGTVRESEIEKRAIFEANAELRFEPLIVSLVHEIRADFPGEGLTWGHLAWWPRVSWLRRFLFCRCFAKSPRLPRNANRPLQPRQSARYFD